MEKQIQQEMITRLKNLGFITEGLIYENSKNIDFEDCLERSKSMDEPVWIELLIILLQAPILKDDIEDNTYKKIDKSMRRHIRAAIFKKDKELCLFYESNKLQSDKLGYAMMIHAQIKPTVLSQGLKHEIELIRAKCVDATNANPYRPDLYILKMNNQEKLDAVHEITSISEKILLELFP